MSGGFSKIVINGATPNTPGGAIQPVILSNVGAGSATTAGNTVAIPAGTFTLLPTANVTIEFNAYTGSANAWTAIVANNTAAPVLISDGVAYRANAVTGTQTVTLWGINGGNAASGTYNS
jgi:hypothetical protein